MDLNTCENCKFYNRYYFKFKTRLMYANCGACLNDQINPNKKRKINSQKLPCEYFEQAAGGPLISSDKLQETLSQMKERLDDIALLLNIK